MCATLRRNACSFLIIFFGLEFFLIIYRPLPYITWVSGFPTVSCQTSCLKKCLHKKNLSESECAPLCGEIRVRFWSMFSDSSFFFAVCRPLPCIHWISGFPTVSCLRVAYELPKKKNLSQSECAPLCGEMRVRFWSMFSDSSFFRSLPPVALYTLNFRFSNCQLPTSCLRVAYQKKIWAKVNVRHSAAKCVFVSDHFFRTRVFLIIYRPLPYIPWVSGFPVVSCLRVAYELPTKKIWAKVNVRHSAAKCVFVSDQFFRTRVFFGSLPPVALYTLDSRFSRRQLPTSCLRVAYKKKSEPKWMCVTLRRNACSFLINFFGL
jgi:hypothetical protein